MQPSVLILGVGNILFTDEGLGVRAVEHLQARFVPPPHVRLLDGGTLGIRLMHAITSCDLLLVLDAVLGNGEPGALYRLENDALRNSLSFHDSMHQTNLVDVLTLCDLSGHKPETIVFGMEPADITTLADALTPAVSARIPDLAALPLEELRRRGILDEDASGGQRGLWPLGDVFEPLRP